MSHISTIELEITDLACLKKACQSLNLKFNEGQKTYKWYGRLVNPANTPLPEGITEKDLGHCDHSISSTSANYEIGILRRNGKYLLLADFWNAGGLHRVVGKNAGLLKQAYTVERVKNEAKKKGFRLTHKVTESSIRLTLTA